MLRGTCGRLDCTGDCRECYGEYEEKGEIMESEICSIGHEEIVYFSGSCPLCNAMYKIEALSDIVDELIMVLEPEGVEA